MNKKTNLEYVDFQNEFAKYFKVIEVLGNHFFKEGNKANVYLSLDTEDLDEIFSDVRGEEPAKIFW